MFIYQLTRRIHERIPRRIFTAEYKREAVQLVEPEGNYCDNVPMESFFSTLKTESLHHYRFTTRKQARQTIFEYIEVFYNKMAAKSR